MYIARVWYVNSQFPTGKINIISEKESYQTDELKYSMVSGEIISGKKYIEIFHDENSFLEDENIFITYFEVENMSKMRKDMGVGDIVITNGAYANGTNLFSLYTLNGDDFDGTIDAGEKKLVGICSTIAADVNELTEYGNDWRMRLSGWPNRVEFVIPMEES